MPPQICPQCGAIVPAEARSCPGCGSDDETGWSAEARLGTPEIPDPEFDYDDFVQREFGDGGKTFRLQWWWWLVAIALLGVCLKLWIG
jgi:hypothetical protein